MAAAARIAIRAAACRWVFARWPPPPPPDDEGGKRHDVVRSAASEAGGLASACLELVAAGGRGGAWSVGGDVGVSDTRAFEAHVARFESLLHDAGGPFFGGSCLSIADCLLYPFWERAALCARRFASYDAAAALPALGRWAESVRGDATAGVACLDPAAFLATVERTRRLDWFDYERCGAADVLPQLARLGLMREESALA